MLSIILKLCNFFRTLLKFIKMKNFGVKSTLEYLCAQNRAVGPSTNSIRQIFASRKYFFAARKIISRWAKIFFRRAKILRFAKFSPCENIFFAARKIISRRAKIFFRRAKILRKGK